MEGSEQRRTAADLARIMLYGHMSGLRRSGRHNPKKENHHVSSEKVFDQSAGGSKEGHPGEPGRECECDSDGTRGSTPGSSATSTGGRTKCGTKCSTKCSARGSSREGVSVADAFAASEQGFGLSPHERIACSNQGPAPSGPWSFGVNRDFTARLNRLRKNAFGDEIATTRAKARIDWRRPTRP